MLLWEVELGSELGKWKERDSAKHSGIDSGDDLEKHLGFSLVKSKDSN